MLWVGWWRRIADAPAVTERRGPRLGGSVRERSALKLENGRGVLLYFENCSCAAFMKASVASRSARGAIAVCDRNGLERVTVCSSREPDELGSVDTFGQMSMGSKLLVLPDAMLNLLLDISRSQTEVRLKMAEETMSQ